MFGSLPRFTRGVTVVRILRSQGPHGLSKTRSQFPAGLCRSVSSSTEFDYDVCVIGGGPSGFAATIRAWDFEKKVCLVEKREAIGGAMIHGAMCSKMLWELAHENRLVRNHVPAFSEAYSSIKDRVKNATTMKEEQLIRQLDSLEIPYHLGSSWTFVDANTIETKLPSGETKRITAENFVISTGSRPRCVDKHKVDFKSVITSDEVLSLPRFPGSIVIIGAGVIGCEYATIFSNFGQTKVYLINERRARLLPAEDEDLTSLVTANLEAAGTEVLNNCQVKSITHGDHDVEVSVKDLDDPDGPPRVIRAEKVLTSVGRIPNTDNLNLEQIGIEFNENGTVKVTEGCRSTLPNIYLAGDASADIGLVNVGEMEGRFAIQQMYPDDDTEEATDLCYNEVSSIMFLEPEIACIGLNETAAKQRNIDYKVARYSYSLVNRACISSGNRRRNGFVKILVTNDDEMRFLGMRALGLEASALIETAILMIKEQRPIRDLSKVIHPHPAISEAVQEAVRLLLGNSIMKAQCFSEDLQIDHVECLESGDVRIVSPCTPLPTEKTDSEKVSVPTYN